MLDNKLINTVLDRYHDRVHKFGVGLKTYIAFSKYYFKLRLYMNADISLPDGKHVV